jgi:carboxyl-terminal processing protease
MGGLVLDLRSNPGGLLDSAVKVADLFIDDGMLMTIKPRRGRETVYIGKHEGSYLDCPMVCLVNDGTARGSEIVAGCLQDHGRAIILGERTSGSTSLNTLLPLEGGGMIRFANALMCRPSGKNLTKWMTPGREGDDWGVLPHKGFAIKLTSEERKAFARNWQTVEAIWPRGAKMKPRGDRAKEAQLEGALAWLRKQIR